MALHILETVGVTLVVSLTGTAIASFTLVDEIVYVVGSVLSVGFVVYRILTWDRRLADFPG